MISWKTRCFDTTPSHRKRSWGHYSQESRSPAGDHQTYRQSSSNSEVMWSKIPVINLNLFCCYLHIYRRCCWSSLIQYLNCKLLCFIKYQVVCSKMLCKIWSVPEWMVNYLYLCVCVCIYVEVFLKTLSLVMCTWRWCCLKFYVVLEVKSYAGWMYFRVFLLKLVDELYQFPLMWHLIVDSQSQLSTWLYKSVGISLYPWMIVKRSWIARKELLNWPVLH